MCSFAHIMSFAVYCGSQSQSFHYANRFLLLFCLFCCFVFISIFFKIPNFVFKNAHFEFYDRMANAIGGTMHWPLVLMAPVFISGFLFSLFFEKTKWNVYNFFFFFFKNSFIFISYQLMNCEHSETCFQIGLLY